MSGQHFRILCLDGGGIRGVYAAAVLASIEEASGKRIVEHFDLIVGTSTGGILAVALGLGIPAEQILEFYRRHGPTIFPKVGWLGRLRRDIRWLRGPKYNARPLNDALVEVLGERAFGESLCRLAIPAYDIVSNKVHVFKTAHHARFRQDYKRKAVEVIRATTAAPTYFEATTTGLGECLVDGGIWANCPSMVGVAEALDLGIALPDMKLLSIGTLGEAQDFVRAARGGGLFHYFREKHILSLLMDAQARGAWSQTRLLLSERAQRIDQTVKPGLYSLDDSRELDNLIARGRHDGRTKSNMVINEFLTHPASPFTPVYKPSPQPSTEEAA